MGRKPVSRSLRAVAAEGYMLTLRVILPLPCRPSGNVNNPLTMYAVRSTESYSYRYSFLGL